MAQEGLTRYDLGKEQFLNRVWDWRKLKGDSILGQLEELGASLDWDKTQFTMSPEYTNSVNTAFIQLFNKGLIYRKKSLVNWSCVLQSTISDIEVTHVNVDKRSLFDIPGYREPVELGVITDIAYKLTNSEAEIIVSTTRPETMLGDTAIAVNPTDERYSHLIGRTAWHPFRQEEIPIIADTYVDPAFGTGAVKITPAHDPNDFEMGARHSLKSINILNPDGTLNEIVPEFCGQHRFSVRESICARLDELGLYRGDREHGMSVPVCGRTGDIVEPMMKFQWFLDTSKIAELARDAVKDKDLILDPDTNNPVWERFLSNEKTKDWCISRQLWWGHRIPAWFCCKDGDEEKGVWTAAESKDQALLRASNILGCAVSELIAEQDEDVLDTWFSSGIYPFAVFGWPEKTPELSQFYPLDLMETGHDILFFWVARMVMLGIGLTGQLPFHDAMLHGIICDSQGRKMSKSLGNVIDPLNIIRGSSLESLKQDLDISAKNGYLSEDEVSVSKSNLEKQFPKGIPASGADQLRWALLSYDVKSEYINLDLSLVPRAGAWCNKIWQVSRFLNMAHQTTSDAGTNLSAIPTDFQPRLIDMWILNQLARTVSSVNSEYEARNLHNVEKELRKFLYGDVCDVYVEYIKQNIQNPEDPGFLPSLLFLHSCILSSLKMIHPIMPFITEELYHRLPKLPSEKRKESIMVENFPLGVQWSGFINPNLEDLMETVLKIISGIRGLKANYSLIKGSNPAVIVHCDDQHSVVELDQFREIIQRLTNCGEINFVENKIEIKALPVGCVLTSVENLSIALNLGPYLDTEKEMKKVEERIGKNERDRKKLEKSMKGKFQFRSSPEIVAEKRRVLDEELERLQEQFKVLKELKE
ncbi:valine--tRNA ligase isoform X2 [Eurytemora carolleeae]|nr:valine--tRNA ligase isoform X2 [Eurytemora carolleeae]|eukprot:XP_023349810.1 valine--tRNA ligase-like isoform X2 [Eurytemora affinis]